MCGLCETVLFLFKGVCGCLCETSNLSVWTVPPPNTSHNNTHIQAQKPLLPHLPLMNSEFALLPTLWPIICCLVSKRWPLCHLRPPAWWVNCLGRPTDKGERGGGRSPRKNGKWARVEANNEGLELQILFQNLINHVFPKRGRHGEV